MPTTVGLAICALVGALALARLRRQVRATTLTAPWWWACGSFTLAAGVEIWLSLTAADNLPDRLGHTHLRYAAAVSTFWPLMALLGAKRPQDRAWQFIVVSLWVVLLLPAAEGYLHARQAALILPPAWAAFILGLVGLGVVNGLPTRRWPTTLAAAGARLALLSPMLPIDALEAARTSATLPVVGVALLSLAIVFEALRPARRRAERPIDRVWLDFRDAFGSLWALRVAERFNASARQLNWGVRLRWRGLDQDPQQPAIELTPETEALVRQNLETLLRRFVSAEWFASRWDDRLGSA